MCLLKYQDFLVSLPVMLMLIVDTNINCKYYICIYIYIYIYIVDDFHKLQFDSNVNEFHFEVLHKVVSKFDVINISETSQKIDEFFCLILTLMAMIIFYAIKHIKGRYRNLCEK